MTTTTTEISRDTTSAAPSGDWRTSALCQQVDPDLFFPVAHTYGWRKQTEAAKRVCGRCPVRQACLEWALETGQPAGVWGGMSEQERQSLSRVRRASILVCLDRQVWIEKELAEGRTQKAIAAELQVDRAALSRAVRQFNDERAAGLSVEILGVKA